MRRAALLLSGLCACALRAPRVEITPCSATSQCDRPQVCFLGECRGHSAALALVAAEIRPPNDSPLGVAQVPGIDLQQKVVNDFALAPPFAVSGTVWQEQDASASPAAVPGAVITFTDHAPPIPDRVEQVVARSDNSGSFAARLPQGTWDVLVQPPSPLPPYRTPTPLATATAAPALPLVLPRVGSLAQFQSALTADGGPLPGADVTAVDSSGNALSTPAEAQADGGFALYLPPGASGYYLQVGPPSEPDGGMAASALDPLPNYALLPPTTPSVAVALPPSTVLQGSVLDATGAPVASARVYAQSDGMPWSLARSTTTAADGTYSLLLRAGQYVVEAAPASGADGPAVSGEIPVAVPLSGPPLTITCPAKIRGVGLIVRPDGSAASANYQITATRLADRLLTARNASTTATDSAGIWHIVADPGRYRLEVVPSADSGLPRKIVQIDLLVPSGAGEISLPQITISPPIVVGGTVHGAPPGAADAPVVNATVSFYSQDASGHSVFLGSSATDVHGQYSAILPDVAQPGAAY